MKKNSKVTVERVARACARLEEMRFAYESLRYCVSQVQGCQEKDHLKDEHELCEECELNGGDLVEQVGMLMSTLLEDHGKLRTFLQGAIPKVFKGYRG